MIGRRVSGRQAADDVELVPRRCPGDQGVEAVLAGQRLGQRAGAASERGNAPLVAVRAVLGIPGLVGTEEAAQSEMDVTYRGGQAAVPGAAGQATMGRRGAQQRD